MKATLTLRFACLAILTVFQLTAKSQMYISMNGGASFGKRMEVKDEYLTRKYFRVGLMIGYSFKDNEKARGILEANMHVPTTRILSNTALGLSGGPVLHLMPGSEDEEHDILFVPTVGYYYCLVSTDLKYLNTFTYGYGARLQKYRCYVSANNIRNTWQLSFGLIGFM